MPWSAIRSSTASRPSSMPLSRGRPARPSTTAACCARWTALPTRCGASRPTIGRRCAAATSPCRSSSRPSRWRARCTPRAALAQAANTLRFDADGWLGDNTDGIGLVRDIERNAGVPLAGKRVLLIGAGGAAAGALGPAARGAPAALVVANRTLAKAQALVERHRGAGRGTRRAVGLRAGRLRPRLRRRRQCHAPRSLQGADMPVRRRVLRPRRAGAGHDVRAGGTALHRTGRRRHGARGRDGLGMLVEQAAEAFALWRGVMPDTAPVLAALRERLAAASR